MIREFCTEHRDIGTTTTREFVYLYDESGIIGVMYSVNGAGAQPYFYRRNLQGDVVAIYDSNCVRKVEYAYDAFGNCSIVYSASDTNVASINPIRYRGYYYDKETKLYYLNARCYNPEWRRFISPDDTSYLDPESVNGLNLYAYCYNDPVNYADPSGHSVVGTIVAGFFIASFLSAGINLVTQLNDNNGDWGKIDCGSIINDFIVSGALGISLALGVVYLGPFIAAPSLAAAKIALIAFGISTTVSFAAGATGYMVQQAINHDDIDYNTVFAQASFTAIQSVFNFEVGGLIGSYETIGTKGKPLFGKEWIRKLIRSQYYLLPFKKAFNEVYDELGT